MLTPGCSVRLRKSQHISHKWGARALSSSLADVMKSCLGVGPVAAHTGNLVAREVAANRRPCGEAAPVIFAFANPPFQRLTLRDSCKILWLDPSHSSSMAVWDTQRCIGFLLSYLGVYVKSVFGTKSLESIVPLELRHDQMERPWSVRPQDPQL